MAADFNKIFSISLKYPVRKDAYLVMFLVQLVFGVIGWFLTGYFIGDAIGLEGMPVMENIIAFMTYFLPVIIVSWLVTLFLLPAYFDNSMNFHNGKRKRFLDGFDISRKRFLPLLATSIILALIAAACFGGLILVMYSQFVLGSDLTLLAIGALWFLIGLIAGVVLLFTLFLAPVFCVLEKVKPLDSLKKSWKLVAKNKVNTLAFFIIFLALFVAISLAGSIPESFYILVSGEIAAISVESFSFLLIRIVFNVYLTLFAYSSLVGYYLAIKKKL